MCHGVASSAFPEPGAFSSYSNDIQATMFGDENATQRIAILPDIYGSNPFYQGFAARIAAHGAHVYLIDTFAGLGDIPKATREAAFERRHKIKDATFIDSFEGFVNEEKIDGVVGFCLGGLYVFELARRKIATILVGFYPFPQGLPNQDALAVPFDYLPDVKTRHTILVGSDDSMGPENVERLKLTAANSAALDLHVFETSGHGFLADLTSDDPLKRDNAKRALAICDQALGLKNHDRLPI